MRGALKLAGVVALTVSGGAPGAAWAQTLPASWAGAVCGDGTVAGAIAAGDSAYELRDAKSALVCFRMAVTAATDTEQADPRLFRALCRASRTEVDLAEPLSRGRARDTLLLAATVHAEAAIRIRPNAAEGHFALARALGRRALSMGTMDRIRYARIVRDEALAALAHDSTHAGAMDVLGVWNAEIMRVNGLARSFARKFLGAEVFALASWAEAERLLEAAVRLEPGRIVHRLDLANVYAGRGDWARAREQYEWIAAAPAVEPNDDMYKREAAERLRDL